jgi:flagellar motor switch protein FliN/FliY
MFRLNEPIGHFLDALAGELQRLLSPEGTGQAAVSWSSPSEEGSDLIWWSCALSVDPACRIYAGADRRTWRLMIGASAADSGALDSGPSDDTQESWFALLSQSVEQAARGRFGALVSCEEPRISEASPDAGTRVSVLIERGGASPAGTLSVVLSPDLASALGGGNADGVAEPLESEPLVEANRPVERSAPSTASPLDILQNVEIPVSVSFGRTQMRLKDLLGLANGSVVQLDRELGDEVEVRVNNCLIARGEVVAVDGNYGVRILELASGETASGPNGQGVRGALRAG